MAFPEDEILDIRTELQIDGAWVDISSDVRAEAKIVINQGQSGEARSAEPARCNLTLGNPDGKYSPRNPNSPYFELIGNNTPIRVSVPQDEVYLSQDGDPANFATTPDTAALDITGDLDLRAEATLDWHDPNLSQVLVGKWDTTGDQRSYSLRVYNHHLWLNWSEDGADNFAAAWRLPVLPDRYAVRATLDVDNGDSGFTIRMYVGPSIDGPWTQISDDATLTGTPETSVFASTAALATGADDQTVTPARTPATGHIHAVEVRSGIDGTAVANPDFTAQTAGDTSFTDGAGLTWTVNGDAALDDRDYRFHGEVSELPPEWEAGGHDVWVPIQASGPRRRLSQGTAPASSALYRRLSTRDTSELLAYWPMEEAEGAIQAASPLAGVNPMRTSGMQFAQDSTLAASGPLPQVTPNASLSGIVPRGTAGEWDVHMFYNIPTAPSAATTVLEINTTGTVRKWRIQMQSGTATIRGFNSAGTETVTQTVSIGADVFEDWNRLQFSGEDVGSNVRWTITWYNIGEEGGAFNTTLTGDAGRVTSVSNPDFNATVDGMSIGHIAVFNSIPAGASAYSEGQFVGLGSLGADTGFAGEESVERILRLRVDEAEPIRFGGVVVPARFNYDAIADMDDTAGAPSSERMGAQSTGTLLGLLDECAEVDGGLWHESRTALALKYRPRWSLYNQTPAAVLAYADLMPGLRPKDDDAVLRNDVTVKVRDGSSGRVVQDEGRRSVARPPDGVGQYDEQVTLNLWRDEQAVPHAGHRVHLGSWDEQRVPVVNIALHRNPELTAQVQAVDVGDRIQITSPPAWMPPDTIDLLVQGYTETLQQYEWSFAFNCTPARAWDAGHVEDDTYGWADTDGSQLAEDLTETSTDAEVLTTEGDLWVTSAEYPDEFPFDLRVGGEVVTCTEVADYGAEDTFARSLTAAVTDTFGRTVASGWGTSTSGHVWSNSGGTNADYATTGSAGTMSVGVVNSSRFTTLAAITDADVDVVVDITVPVVATGASISTGLRLRSADTSNYYYVETVRATSGTINVLLVSRVAGVSTTIATSASKGTYTAGQTWRLRARLVGTVLQAKLWKPADSEPTDWDVQATTSTITAGGPIGLRSILSTGNTNTLPVTVSYDNLTMYTPSQGFGTSSSGHTWTTSGGAASDYGVTDGYAAIALTSVDSSRKAVLAPALTDSDVKVTCRTPLVADTDSIDLGLVSRYANSSNYYHAVLHFHDDSTMDLRIRKLVAGTYTTLAISDTIAGYEAGSSFTLRLRTVGSVLRARAWPVAAAEPVLWQAVATDTSLTAAGKVGVRANLQASNANPRPVDARFDDFQILGPQVMTLTRSVNGISKSHAAGADVRLAHPVYVAL